MFKKVTLVGLLAVIIGGCAVKSVNNRKYKISGIIPSDKKTIEVIERNKFSLYIKVDRKNNGLNIRFCLHFR